MGEQGLYVPTFDEDMMAPFLKATERLTRQKVIVVHSTKGGVGKTTIAKNLAHAMTYYGKKVCIVDTNSDGNMAEVMNTPYNYTLDQWNNFDESLDVQTALEMLAKDDHGVSILPSGTSPLVYPTTVDLIMKILSRVFEIIIVDTETKLTHAMLKSLDYADVVLIVGNDNPNIYARLSTRLQQLMGDPYGMQGLGIAREKIGVIVNQHVSLNKKRIQEILQFPVSQVFEFEDKVQNTEYLRKSTFFDLPKSKFAKEIGEFAKELLKDVGYTDPKKKGKKGLFR